MATSRSAARDRSVAEDRSADMKVSCHDSDFIFILQTILVFSAFVVESGKDVGFDRELRFILSNADIRIAWSASVIFCWSAASCSGENDCYRINRTEKGHVTCQTCQT